MVCLNSGQFITKRVTLATGSLGHTGFFSKMNNMDLSREKKWPWLVFSNTKCLSLGSIDLSQGDRIVYRETRAVEEVTKTSDFPSVCKAVCSNEKIGGWWGGCLFLSLSSKDGLGLQLRTIALQVIHHVHHEIKQESDLWVTDWNPKPKEAVVRVNGLLVKVLKHIEEHLSRET